VSDLFTALALVLVIEGLFLALFPHRLRQIPSPCVWAGWWRQPRAFCWSGSCADDMPPREDVMRVGAAYRLGNRPWP